MRINLWNKTLAAAVMVGLLFPLSGQAGMMFDHSNCSKRPLSDFLDKQGSSVIFFPDVKDMLAWTDGGFVNFALVDYAGLANDYLAEEGISLGTKMNGRVIECVQGDGTAVISVVLSTQKALGFAQSIEDLIGSGFDFLNTPTIFGVKAQDVAAGATPALGPVSLRTTFTIDAAGAELPDVRIAFQENNPDVRPFNVDFRSTTVGMLTDGTRARLRIQQVGATDENGDLVFSREIVEIAPDKGKP